MNNYSNLLYKDTLDTEAATWLEQNIYMPREVSPNAPGQLNLSAQPWIRDILESVIDPRTKEINLVMGAQTGKTTILLLSWMLLSKFYPNPCLIGLSTDPLADRLVKRRLLPLIKANPYWADKLPPENRGQESMILFPAMTTFYTGARTADKLASMPASILLLDEVSKWQKGSIREAHPYLLVKERVKSFSSHLIVSSSTPSEKEEIYWQEFLHSSQSYYYMPCPHCGEYIKFEFSRDTLRWQAGSIDTVQRTAYYSCPCCQGKITDNDKANMMQLGEWRKEKPDHAKGHLGYHLNSLYSPFVTFGEVAAEFVKAQASIIKSEAIRNFTNSWLALPYSEKGQATSDNDIESIISPTYFRGEIPSNTAYIVLGGDAGQNKSHWVAAAICLDGTIRVIDWGYLLAYSSSKGGYGYQKLIKEKRWQEWQVDIAYLDSGYSTEEIYQECLRDLPCKINPTKGSTALGVWNETRVRTHEDLLLYTYSDYSLKMDLSAAIKAKRILLPSDADQELIKGLQGQEVIVTKSGRRQWKELKEDHYNDCLKLCLFSTWVNPLSLEENTEGTIQDQQELSE